MPCAESCKQSHLRDHVLIAAVAHSARVLCPNGLGLQQLCKGFQPAGGSAGDASHHVGVGGATHFSSDLFWLCQVETMDQQDNLCASLLQGLCDIFPHLHSSCLSMLSCLAMSSEDIEYAFVEAFTKQAYSSDQVTLVVSSVIQHVLPPIIVAKQRKAGRQLGCVPR